MSHCQYDAGNSLFLIFSEVVLTLIKQAIFFVYGGDYKRGTKQLVRLLNRPNCVGLWRSVARYHLAKFMSSTGDKKLDSLFDQTDKNDHLFEFTKKTVLQ